MPELTFSLTTTSALIATMLLLWIAFWCGMLWECAAKERDHKARAFWLWAVALSSFLGAVVYVVYRRPRRIAEWGE
jgi:cbb3-type cytochrome oxidase subunit 3